MHVFQTSFVALCYVEAMRASGGATNAAEFAVELCKAVALWLPALPGLSVLVSCLFLPLVGVVDRLGLDRALLNVPIYYGTFCTLLWLSS